MELFRWRVRNWLVVVVAVLLVARAMGKEDGQVEGGGGDDGDDDGGDSSPAAQPAPAPAPARARHGRTRQHQHQHQPKPQHGHEHGRDHGHEHDHRQAPRGRLASLHHKPQAKHQPAPLALPHARGRSDDGDTHDLLDCEPQPGDKLLARSVVKAEFRPLGFAEASWFFPQNGRDQRTIHCVRALDQRRDGYGGYPRIVRGGVGHHYVELSFKSDFSRGFHFVVEVYGR